MKFFKYDAIFFEIFLNNMIFFFHILIAIII